MAPETPAHGASGTGPQQHAAAEALAHPLIPQLAETLVDSTYRAQCNLVIQTSSYDDLVRKP